MNKIICISGTNRPNNYTSKALKVVTDELTAQGKATEVFDARDLTLAFPGTPATPDAVRFKEAVKNASGVIIATPEY
ncbi:NAD(P)H-dependent oxidoreductase, partial [bacterium]|nr:NAD(P)H-dependent oxidoreductase [bacterium]